MRASSLKALPGIEKADRAKYMGIRTFCDERDGQEILTPYTEFQFYAPGNHKPVGILQCFGKDLLGVLEDFPLVKNPLESLEGNLPLFNQLHKAANRYEQEQLRHAFRCPEHEEKAGIPRTRAEVKAKAEQKAKEPRRRYSTQTSLLLSTIETTRVSVPGYRIGYKIGLVIPL